jgi:glycosyltransferase involved in cell wall biosynthesis
MNKHAEISLILTAQDRIEDLKRFISSLLVQSFKGKIELIFINQGTYQIDSDFKFPENIDYIPINIGHQIPLSHARNIGLKHATGEIVAFPDDDCWYGLNLLENVMDYFKKHKELDCICTNVYDPERKKSYGKRPTGVIKRIKFINLFILPSSVGIFIKLNALDRIGRGFDESLGAGTFLGSGEEMELISRLLLAKLKVEYVGGIQVFHPILDYKETDCKKYYSYGLGFGYLNGKLVRFGHITLLWYLSEIIARSTLGVIFNLRMPLKRQLYWKRLQGIANGFICGLRGSLIGQS